MLLNHLRGLQRDERERRVLVLGLDKAGKTTICKALAGRDITNIPVTQGFDVTVINTPDFKLNTWDLGGLAPIRPYWSNYFPCTDALVYVVDSSDRSRISESHDTLRTVLSSDDLSQVPLVVLGNKLDIEGGMSAGEVQNT